MNSENEVKELLLAQIKVQCELVENSKKEMIAYQESAQQYSELQKIELAKKRALEINNQLQQELLHNAEEILGLLRVNLAEKPIEKELKILERTIDSMRTIIEFMGRELLKNHYSREDQALLLKAITDIGGKPMLDMGFHANRDVTTQDISVKTGDIKNR